ncbi:MAG: hypothetical protein QOJ41_2694, partial [Acidobacteriaceae bacterium]|nr:hypothetical protein [Acidobacteriaceae bacterium]
MKFHRMVFVLAGILSLSAALNLVVAKPGAADSA